MRQCIMLLLLISAALASCNNDSRNVGEQRLRNENLQLRQQVDSLKDLISRSSRRMEGDTVLTLPEDKPVNNKGGFAGKHSLTLQWIGWDKPGSVSIVPAENGWYTISGKQANNENYLKINGRIKPLTENELEFEGEIESRVLSLNNGEPCLKTGKRSFKATGDRQYWRLQDMNNCDGATVDYIDIYF
jgi:hypothetical protein